MRSILSRVAYGTAAVLDTLPRSVADHASMVALSAACTCRRMTSQGTIHMLCLATRHTAWSQDTQMAEVTVPLQRRAVKLIEELGGDAVLEL